MQFLRLVAWITGNTFINKKHLQEKDENEEQHGLRIHVVVGPTRSNGLDPGQNNVRPKSACANLGLQVGLEEGVQ